MCPKHIMVHRTSPLLGGVHCALGQGDTIVFRGSIFPPTGWLHKPLVQCQHRLALAVRLALTVGQSGCSYASALSVRASIPVSTWTRPAGVSIPVQNGIGRRAGKSIMQCCYAASDDHERSLAFYSFVHYSKHHRACLLTSKVSTDCEVRMSRVILVVWSNLI